MTILCSLPAALLLWSALSVGKRADEPVEEEDTPAQSISTTPIRSQAE